MIPGKPLSSVELHLACLLADTDLSTPRLAVLLCVSPSTVEARKSRIYAKLGIHSRAGLRTVLMECELASVGGA